MGALAAVCTQGTNPTDCTANMCETIGAVEICKQCKTAGKVPVDGTCTAYGTASTCKKSGGGSLDGSEKSCEKCEGVGIFLFMGGCYNKDNSPGNLVCTTVADGKCTTCTTGGSVFQNKATQPTAGRECILCSDNTGSDSNLGVANCATCTAPTTTTGTATCTKCVSPNYLKPDGTVCGEKGTACASNTEFGKEDSVNGNKCISCGDATDGVTDCKTCTAPSEESTKPMCTECNNNKIVKTVTASGKSVTSCVEPAECKDGFFVETTTNDGTSSKVCTACGDENCDVCAASGAKKCSKCKTDGTKIYLQKEADSQTGTCIEKASCTGTNYIDEEAKTCSTCASAGTTGCKTCAKTDGVVACASCEDGQKFGLGKKLCVAKCPTNFQAGADNICVCNDGFTPSTDSSACVAASSSANLSTGAIAGISVAAVVVVGGLVGFLCWWFVCRGKA